MSILNYTLSEITNRIILNLPVRFIKDESSNVYKLFQAIADGFMISTTQIDELFRQTSLTTATGSYTDEYISSLSAIGRYKEGVVYPNNDETDEDYKQRYKNTIYVYNSTKLGLKQIVIDMLGNEPFDMYTGSKKGAFANGRYYYNSGFGAVYGDGEDNPFVGYIEFLRRPAPIYLEELRKTINKCRGYGITIYLKYPSTDDLTISFDEGTLSRAEIFS